VTIKAVTSLTPSFHQTWLADHDLTVGLPEPVLPPAPTLKKIRLLQYRFHTHWHPYVNDLINRMIKGYFRGLQAPSKTQPALSEQLVTAVRYNLH